MVIVMLRNEASLAWRDSDEILHFVQNDINGIWNDYKSMRDERSRKYKRFREIAY